jgi:CheY-like chemotaxis protein
MKTPSADTPAPCHVAFEGFSEFERTALASFFRLADLRVPAYAPVGDAAHAEFLIVDADRPGEIDAVRANGRTRDTVFVGAQAPAGAIAWLPRPIDPMHIVRELDVLVERRRSGTHDTLEPAMFADVDLLLQDIGTLRPTEPGSGSTSSTDMRVSQAGGGGRDVLVVDDSAIARKFLAQRLERFGYRVQLASSGEEALALFEPQSFAIAFVDITLGPANAIDGLRVCQAIKQRAPTTMRGTAVVIVTGQASATARVRGSLAGCDAYLTKPLMERDFIAALHQVDPLFQWEAATVA